MKCPGCGANLGLEDQFCPYCGTANPHARQHQAEMQNFRHEFEKTRDRVEERANRFAGFAVPLTILGISESPYGQNSLPLRVPSFAQELRTLWMKGITASSRRFTPIRISISSRLLTETIRS